MATYDMTEQMPPPKGRQRRARLVDVAERSGVTKSVVSRIMNNDETLRTRPETRARVLAVAAELGYRPHATAQALSLARAGAAALLIPDLSNPVYAAITRGSYRRAKEQGYVLLLAEDAPQEIDDDYFDLVQAGRVDGLMVASAAPGHALIERLQAEPTAIPHVFINREVPGSGRNVALDMEGASAAAVDYLVQYGHHRIGIVSGPEELQPARARLTGFVKRMTHHGLDSSRVAFGSFTEQGGHDAVVAMLRKHPEVTAVYTQNFGQGVGALHAAHADGRDIPGDLSIISYDDLPVAEFLNPPLTTISMPLAELGALAVDALVEQINGQPPGDRRIEGGWKVVPRSSVAPPRSS